MLAADACALITPHYLVLWLTFLPFVSVLEKLDQVLFLTHLTMICRCFAVLAYFFVFVLVLIKMPVSELIESFPHYLSQYHTCKR